MVSFLPCQLSLLAHVNLFLLCLQVSLAESLDMYYEDVFTLPSERLSCSAVATPSNLALNKAFH